ncbi:MAG: glutamate--cysteine ligase [Pseudomonadota bacterium]
MIHWQKLREFKSHMNHADLITTKAQLIDYFQKGCKLQAQWRVGLEFEKFVYQSDHLKRATFKGHQGIETLLKGLTRYGWLPVFEQSYLIALYRKGSTVTLEPGGQIELSSSKHTNVHQLEKELLQFERETQEVGTQLKLDFLAMGYDPKSRLQDIPWMPKQRYSIMRSYMLKKGNLGHNMMQATAAIQVALDYSSEADMAKKLRVALALQPMLTGLLSNSPFKEGKVNGFQSYRSHIWKHTDPDRCGLLSFAFKENMSFESYVDYALGVPMYFIKQGDDYLDVSGHPFQLYLDGKLPGHEGKQPTLQDWQDHLTTLFPEIRLKQFLEMRGVDGGDPSQALGLAAFWRGILYDSCNLQAVYERVKDWSYEEVREFLEEVARSGLNARLQGTSLLDLGKEVIDLAEQGLKYQRIHGQDDRIYLDPLKEIIDSGKTPAQRAIETFVSCDKDIDQTIRTLIRPKVSAICLNDISSKK